MVVKATIVQTVETLETGQNSQTTISESRRLDYIYDSETLGFEKDPIASTKRLKAHNPQEDIDLEDGTTKRETYISAKINPNLRIQIVKVLNKFKY